MSAWRYMAPSARIEAVQKGAAEGKSAAGVAAVYGASEQAIATIAERERIELQSSPPVATAERILVPTATLAEATERPAAEGGGEGDRGHPGALPDPGSANAPAGGSEIPEAGTLLCICLSADMRALLEGMAAEAGRAPEELAASIIAEVLQDDAAANREAAE